MLSLLWLLLALVAALYAYVRYRYSYWQRAGFAYDTDSKIPYGCLERVVKYEQNMGAAIQFLYEKYSKEPFLGIYLLHRPALLVRDVELVRQIMVQNFASFHDRGVYVDAKNDPLSANIFTIRGNDWKSLRSKLSPLFSSSKLKGMFETSNDVGDKMIEYIKSMLPQQGSANLDINHVTTTYAVDIIGSVIFGLDINSFEQPNNDFRLLLNFAQRTTPWNAIISLSNILCPTLAGLLQFFDLKNATLKRFHEIVKRTIETRERNNIVRKDLLQLMIQLRNAGKIQEDDGNYNWSIQQASDKSKLMSLETITAQSFIFYLAGQETTASTSALTIFEMAQNAEVLAKAQREVREVFSRHAGQVSYDSLNEMEYLELCIKETLRKYPGLPLLNRECTQDFLIPGTDKLIKKGTPIVISLFGMQRDAEHFPQPKDYLPERFLESEGNYNPDAYMPFGEGPHICIAARMGKNNAKLAVAKILQNFNIEIMEKQEIQLEKHAVGVVIMGGVYVKMSRRM